MIPAVIIEALWVLVWCLLSFLIGVALAYLVAKHLLPFFAHLMLFILLLAIAHLTGVVTVVINWVIIKTWLNSLWAWLTHLWEMKKWLWFVKEALYILTGIAGFVVTFKKVRVLA